MCGDVTWREQCQNNDNALAVRMTFRRVMCLALLPPIHIQRAFNIIANASPPQMADFLNYFKRTYIGLTADEANRKAVAFATNPEPLPMRMPSPILSASNNNNFTGHDRWNPIMNSTEISIRPGLLPPLNDPIIRNPIYAVEFWNIHSKALLSLAKTNNAMESAHCHYAVCLKIIILILNSEKPQFPPFNVRLFACILGGLQKAN